jgi:hypothetical protein
MHSAINDEKFRGSLKDAFLEGKSMTTGKIDDKLMMRARKPHFKKIDRSLSLNFGGRVKEASRRNIQIVNSSKVNTRIGI